MDSAVLAARLILAVVFAVAAVGKFADLPGSRQSLIGFGLPQRFANVAGTALPFAEFAVAILLVFGPTAEWGAIGALILLLAFITGIASAMRRGEAPPCNCFGAIHSAPASGKTLARNIALTVVALVAVIWGPGPAIDSWISDRTAAELVAVVAGIAALALLAAAAPLWIENRRMRTDLDRANARLERVPFGLPIGSLAPDFSVPDGHGGEVTLSGLLERGKPIVLVFTIAGCGPCEPMLPYLRRLQSIAADRITVALVGISTVERFDRIRQAHGGSMLLIDATKEDPQLQAELDHIIEVGHLYESHHSPAAVVVTPAGTIGSVMVDGRLAIEALIRRTIAESAAATPLTVPAVASAS